MYCGKSALNLLSFYCRPASRLSHYFHCAALGCCFEMNTRKPKCATVQRSNSYLPHPGRSDGLGGFGHHRSGAGPVSAGVPGLFEACLWKLLRLLFPDTRRHGLFFFRLLLRVPYRQLTDFVSKTSSGFFRVSYNAVRQKKKKRIRKKKVQCACRKRTKQKPSRLLPLGAVSRTPPRRRADGIFLCLFYFHLIPPSLKKIGSAKLAIKEPSFVRRSALDVRSGLYSCFGVPAVGMRSSGCFFCPSLVWRHCTA